MSLVVAPLSAPTSTPVSFVFVYLVAQLVGCDTQPHQRRQRSDVNKARARPVSNPAGKPSHSRKIGALTSLYVLDQGPAAAQSARPMKPLSEHPLPLLTSEHIGNYVEVDGEGAEEEEIESWSDSEVSGAA